jgi:hypothetical protein
MPMGGSFGEEEAAMKPSRKLAILVAALVGAVLLGWCGHLVYRTATATRTYTYRVTFTTMPADDGPLARWLRSQPGVVRVAVSREGDTLLVTFDMTASGRDPEPPIVRAAGEQFGYGGWEGTSGGCVVSQVPLFPWQ